MALFNLTSVSGRVLSIPALVADPLDSLVGTWTGTGFNQIWRPANKKTNGNNPNPGQDRFLELNETLETLTFTELSKEIPNRGLAGQIDINLHGIDYVQQISDANVKDSTGKPAGIHFEPGLWLNIPPTDSDPVINVHTLARLANIPHGTTFVAQGTFSVTNAAPVFPVADITPFTIGNPAGLVHFPESNLATVTTFRTAHADIPHVTQAMVDNPNTVLHAGIAGKNIVATTEIKISTRPLNPPPSGGGTSNISFLEGVGGKPNAVSAEVDATFWIETIRTAGHPDTFQLQYSQRVLLNFNGLSWPHFSVATLVKK